MVENDQPSHWLSGFTFQSMQKGSWALSGREALSSTTPCLDLHSLSHLSGVSYVTELSLHLLCICAFCSLNPLWERKPGWEESNLVPCSESPSLIYFLPIQAVLPSRTAWSRGQPFCQQLSWSETGQSKSMYLVNFGRKPMWTWGELANSTQKVLVDTPSRSVSPDENIPSSPTQKLLSGSGTNHYATLFNVAGSRQGTLLHICLISLVGCCFETRCSILLSWRGYVCFGISMFKAWMYTYTETTKYSKCNYF